MPLNRSPPAPLTSQQSAIRSPLQHGFSEPNVSNIGSTFGAECDVTNVTHRYKRKCSESRIDSENQLSIFMTEMKSMFVNFCDQQNNKIEKIYETVADIKNQNTDIRSSVVFLSETYETLRHQIDQLEIERKNTTIYLQDLEDRLEKFERGCRTTCVEIRNIPADKDETKQHLLDTVIRAGAEIKLSIQPYEVKDVFRIGSRDPSNRTIIVNFTSNFMKENFIRMYRKCNKEHNQLTTEKMRISGPCKPVFISENLTPKMKRLFYLARDFAKNNQYRYSWVKNGKIYLRQADGLPQHHIKDESDLRKLTTPK